MDLKHFATPLSASRFARVQYLICNKQELVDLAFVGENLENPKQIGKVS